MVIDTDISGHSVLKKIIFTIILLNSFSENHFTLIGKDRTHSQIIKFDFVGVLTNRVDVICENLLVDLIQSFSEIKQVRAIEVEIVKVCNSVVCSLLKGRHVQKQSFMERAEFVPRSSAREIFGDTDLLSKIELRRVIVDRHYAFFISDV